MREALALQRASRTHPGRRTRSAAPARRALEQALRSPRAQLVSVATLAAAGAAWVGYETSLDPGAAPAHVAVPLRVLIIASLIVGGLLVGQSASRRAMGRLLVAGGFFAIVWLLNGARHEVPYTIGMLAAGFAPALFSYLVLAFPSGKIASPLERRFVLVCAAPLALAWIALVVADRPTFCTPLLHCPPRPGALSLGLSGGDTALSTLVRVDSLLLAVATAVILALRSRRANRHFRRLLMPIVGVAAANVIFLTGFFVAHVAGSGSARSFGVGYVAATLLIPLAILLGLVMERLALARVMSRFVSSLGTLPGEKVQRTMAEALNDPQLKIYYRCDGTERYSDCEGRLPPAVVSDSRRRAVIESEGAAVAMIDFDANLADQEDFIRAAAKSAVLWLAKEQLVSELDASRRSLEESRARLSRTADDERRRIQRDLHDGAQQHLVAMHLKLELALDAIDREPSRSAGLLAEVGGEMEETANDLRGLASNVYPPTLAHFGLADALRSAARRMDLDVELGLHGTTRHRPEIETAIYFVCLEALQNVGKHCGAGSRATVRVWEVKRWLFLEIRDAGRGFDPTSTSGSGLENMRDRVEAFSGRLSVHSSCAGTVIRALVPLRSTGPLAPADGAARRPAPEDGIRAA